MTARTILANPAPKATARISANPEIAKAIAAIDAAVAAIAALRSDHIAVAEGVPASIEAIGDGVYLGDPEAIASAVAEAYDLSQRLIGLADSLGQAHRWVEPLGQLAYRRTKSASRAAYVEHPEAEWL